jgi:hypothetical protein
MMNFLGSCRNPLIRSREPVVARPMRREHFQDLEQLLNHLTGLGSQLELQYPQRHLAQIHS